MSTAVYRLAPPGLKIVSATKRRKMRFGFQRLNDQAVLKPNWFRRLCQLYQMADNCHRTRG
jgi:hypothetical protein